MICPTCKGAGRIDSLPNPEQRLEKIKEYVEKRMSYTQIAEALGIKKGTVQYYVRRYKLKGAYTKQVTNPESRQHLEEEGHI